MDYDNLQETTCDLCQGVSFDQLANRVQFNMSYQVVICKECGLVQINPKPKKEEYDKFYKYEYAKYYGNGSEKLYKERGYKIFDFVQEYLIAEQLNVLEIGSGNGGNLIGISEKLRQGRFFAIEPGEENRISLTRYGINWIGSYYDEMIYDLSTVNVIVMAHVLEHFYSPSFVLNKLYRESSDNTLVIVLVPSIRTIKTFKPLEEYFFRLVHLYYFSLEVLESMLKLSGWKILKSYDKDGEIGICMMKESSLDPLHIPNHYDLVYDDYQKYLMNVAKNVSR